MFRLFSQSPLVHSLEQTKADLMESMGESRKRKDEIEVSSCFFADNCPPLANVYFFFGKKLSSSDKYDLLKVLNGKLRSEKAECAALQARFLYILMSFPKIKDLKK